VLLSVDGLGSDDGVDGSPEGSMGCGSLGTGAGSLGSGSLGNGSPDDGSLGAEPLGTEPLGTGPLVPGSVVGPGSAGAELSLLVGACGELVADPDVGTEVDVIEMVPGSVSVGGNGRSRAPGGADDVDFVLADDDDDDDAPVEPCPLWTSLRSPTCSADIRGAGSELPVIRTLISVGRDVA